MTKITFHGGKMTDPVVIYPDSINLPLSLTEIVRENNLPLYWRCGHGTCGACAVHLSYINESSFRRVMLSNKERNVMLRHRLLSPEAHAETEIAQTPAIWRLACHVSIQENDDLLVTW